jgi:xylulokinase
VWRQIQADVYGREVELVEADEGAAYGAALLAGVGGGVWATVDDACAAAVRVRERTPPDAEGKRVMDERYRIFRAIYPALRRIAEA